MGQDRFYLEKVFPESEKVFSYLNKTVDEIKDNCLYVLDTNVLLIPYLTSKESVKDFERIFKQLKKANRLFIPARVAREFAKNRGQKIADTYSKITESKNKLNNNQVTLEKFPIFESNSDYLRLKGIESEIQKLKDEFRGKLDKLSNDLMNWTWDDPVSKIYKEIFTKDIIIDIDRKEDEIRKEHDFRVEHLVPPGFKKSDQSKQDNGIGDLIIWLTTLEIGRDKNSDIIFVTNEEQTDWFYRQQKTAILPKYELIDEFRRFTNGKSVNIISFSRFLNIQNASAATVKEISELKILDARYFTDSFSYDATSKLNSLIVDNTLDTIANNNLVGDPHLGTLKKLKIIYRVGMEILEKVYNEHDLVHLP